MNTLTNLKMGLLRNGLSVMNSFEKVLINVLKERVSTEEILNELEYPDIVEYVAAAEREKAEDYE